MNFEDIKKIVDKEGRVVIIENQKAYIVARYGIEEKKKEDPVSQEEKKEETLKIEDLPF